MSDYKELFTEDGAMIRCDNLKELEEFASDHGFEDVPDMREKTGFQFNAMENVWFRLDGNRVVIGDRQRRLTDRYADQQRSWNDDETDGEE